RDQRFTCVRLLITYLTESSPAFSKLVHHPGHWTSAAVGGLDPEPTLRVRGTAPHLEYSTLQIRSLHSIVPPLKFSWHTGCRRNHRRRPRLRHWRQNDDRRRALRCGICE